MYSLNNSRAFVLSVFVILGLYSKPSFAGIPAPACKNLAWDHAKDYINNSNETRILAMGVRAENLNSPEAIASYMLEAIQLQVKLEPAMKLLSESPYIKLMAFPITELRNAFVELKQSGKQDLHEANRITFKNLSAFRYGIKSYTPSREYDFSLPRGTVRDQCRLGSCWAYASDVLLEKINLYLMANIGKDPRLEKFKHLTEEDILMSIEHYYVLYIFNESLLAIKNGTVKENEELFEQGGSLKNFMLYAKEFGIGVPQKQWKPFKSYKRALFKDKFLDSLKDLAMYYHDQILAIKKSKEIPSHQKSDLIKAEIAKAAKALEDHIESYTGELDHTIRLGEVNKTYKDFYNLVVAPALKGLKVYSKGDFDHSFGMRTNSVEVIDKSLKTRYISGRFESFVHTAERFEQVIINELKKGKALYIAVSIPTNSFVDPVTGKTHSIINGQNGFVSRLGTEEKEVKIRGGHALVITGYELDANGRIRTLEIQNSWGASHGDKGFWHMDISFAYEHLYHIVAIKTVVD